MKISTRFMIVWCMCFLMYEIYTMCSTEFPSLVIFHYVCALIQAIVGVLFIKMYRNERE